MRTHIMSMTYAPKIEPIKTGDCRQTTRIYNEKNPFKVGDSILIHGWEGRPYRSPWNWRRPKEPVTQIVDMVCNGLTATFWQNPITGEPIGKESCPLLTLPWFDSVMNELARLDGIVPPKGMEYKGVLEGFHGKFTPEPQQFQIIRW